MKKFVFIILILITVAGGSYGFLKWKNNSDQSSQKQISTAVAERKNIVFSIDAAGEILPAEQVSVRPEINGRIATLNVDIGDKVKAGDLLFTLDDQDLQTEKSSMLTEIEGAKLRLDRAERNYKRSLQLYENNLISQEVFEDSKTEYELAKNALDRAEKALKIVEDKLTKTRIVAPFDCTVLTRAVSVGQAVSGSGGYNSGTEVLTIANLKEMIINAHINQADITRLKVGQEVNIEVEAVQGLKLKGIIERIAPQATIRNGIKGFATRIVLQNVDEKVKPGMTAKISIPIESAEGVIAVPLAAVFNEQGKKFAIVKLQDKWERRPISIGVADFFHVEITSGLNEGEIVALEPPPPDKIQEPKSIADENAKPTIEKQSSQSQTPIKISSKTTVSEKIR